MRLNANREEEKKIKIGTIHGSPGEADEKGRPRLSIKTDFVTALGLLVDGPAIVASVVPQRWLVSSRILTSCPPFRFCIVCFGLMLGMNAL